MSIIVLASLTYAWRTRRLTDRDTLAALERERVARDLHDTLLQGVQALIWSVERATRAATQKDLHCALRDAVELARGSLIEARQRLHGLRAMPTVLGHEGILLEFVRVPAGRCSAQFFHQIDGEERAFRGVAGEDLLAVIKEALRNAFEHSGASQIALRLSYGRFYFGARVVDDGIGISEEVLKRGSREGHWGLTGMYERIRLMGGRITIDSRSGRGTAIRIRVPGFRIYR